MMIKNRKTQLLLLLLMIMGLSLALPISAEEHKTVTDMLGRNVEVPLSIERVIAIDDGFVEGIMYRLGIQDRIVALGAPCCRTDFNYSFETVDGRSYEFKNGMNPVKYLIPELVELPVLVEGATAVNYETLASLEPDVVFLREGHGHFCGI